MYWLICWLYAYTCRTVRVMHACTVCFWRWEYASFVWKIVSSKSKISIHSFVFHIIMYISMMVCQFSTYQYLRLLVRQTDPLTEPKLESLQNKVFEFESSLS